MTIHALLTPSVLVAMLVAVPLPAQGGKRLDTTSKEPPAGAPWTKDFADAQRRAQAAGVPIFVYSTKTY